MSSSDELLCDSSPTAVSTKVELDAMAWQLEIAEKAIEGHAATASQYEALLEHAHAMIIRQNGLLQEKQDLISTLELELSRRQDGIDKCAAADESQQVAVLPALRITNKYLDRPAVLTSKKDVGLEELHHRLSVRRDRLAQSLNCLCLDEEQKARVLHSLAMMEESQSVRDIIDMLEKGLSDPRCQAINRNFGTHRIRNHLQIKQNELKHLETALGQPNLAQELETVKTQLEAKTAELATVNKDLLLKQKRPKLSQISGHGGLQEALNQAAEQVHRSFVSLQDQVCLGSANLQVQVTVLVEDTYQIVYDSVLEGVGGSTGAGTSQPCTAQVGRDALVIKARQDKRSSGDQRMEDGEHLGTTEAPPYSNDESEMHDVDLRTTSDDEWEVLDGSDEA